jgi:formylglycine-generating enzyme required for sulfatase activity
MAGNAFEWTNDWYQVDYYTTSSRENPTGPSAGEYRVIRGGSWNNSQKNVRTAHRDYSMPQYMNHLLGFRCVKDAE